MMIQIKISTLLAIIVTAVIGILFRHLLLSRLEPFVTRWLPPLSSLIPSASQTVREPEQKLPSVPDLAETVVSTDSEEILLSPEEAQTAVRKPRSEETQKPSVRDRAPDADQESELPNTSSLAGMRQAEEPTGQLLPKARRSLQGIRSEEVSTILRKRREAKAILDAARREGGGQ